MNIKHGHRGRINRSKEYVAWDHMMQRCSNQNHPRYKDYGGRGITVCEKWRDFRNFLKDVGVAPVGHTLDRINNDGNYEPGNVRWATYREQNNNKRIAQYEFNGESKSLIEWSKFTGIGISTIRSRMKKGWTIERCLTVKIGELRYKFPSGNKNPMSAVRSSSSNTDQQWNRK